MAIKGWIPFIVLVIVLLWFDPITVVQSTEIDDLRLTRNNGTVVRFVVPRSILEDELESLGLTGRVELLSSAMYDSCDGEVTLIIQYAADVTLQEELPPDMVDQVTNDGLFVSIGLPVVALDGSHSVIMLAYFSDAPSMYAPPYLTSVRSVNHVESIEVEEHSVKMRHGCDRMTIEIGDKEDCHGDTFVGDDFDVVTGKDVRLSNFPAGFDWGCDRLGSNVSFCSRLGPFADEINGANGDVCITMSTSKSKRCPASVKVEEMTGIFRDALPFFADMVPIEGLEAEYIEREHGIGIVFPCF